MALVSDPSLAQYRARRAGNRSGGGQRNKAFASIIGLLLGRVRYVMIGASTFLFCTVVILLRGGLFFAGGTATKPDDISTQADRAKAEIIGVNRHIPMSVKKRCRTPDICKTP